MTFFLALPLPAALSAVDLEQLVKFDNIRLQQSPKTIEEARRPLREMGSSVLSVVGSGILAFFLCGWSRWYSFFPIGGDGWELIFDPIGSSLLSAAMAFPLSLLGTLISRWRRE